MSTASNQRRARRSGPGPDRAGTPPASGAPRRRGLRPLLDIAATLSLVWLLLAVVDVLLAAGLEGTTLRDGGFDPPVMTRLYAVELLLLAAAVAAAGWPLGLLSLAASRLVGHRRRRAIAVAALAVSLAALYFSFAASWSLFRSTGVFLDGDSLAFMANDPVLLLQHVLHMELDALLIVPIAVAVAAAATILLHRLVGRRRPAVAAVLVAVGAIGLGLCAIGLARGDVVAADDRTVTPHPVGGMSITRADFYRECRNDRTGPALHALADYRRGRRADAVPLPVSAELPVVRRPLMTWETYLGQVDEATVRPLNVIVLIVESLRPDQLQVFGGPRPVMETVDAIAGEGRAFSFHYAQATHSNYSDLCPLSSQYPLRSPRMHYYPANPTYPRVLIYDVLQARGYHTALISSQNENWGCMLNYLDTGGLDHVFHAETWDGPSYVPDVEEDRSVATFLGGPRRSGKIDDSITIDEAIRWIDAQRDAPWFAYVNLQNSHTPYVVPPGFPRRYSRETLPFVVRYNNYPRSQAQLVKDRYSDSLRYVDAQIARLVEHLKSTGAWDETILVITGDTGESFYERGYAAHGNVVFDDQVRVPLVIRAPGLAPAIDDEPAQQIDVPPTILDLLGLPPHPAFQGMSLVDPAAPRRHRSIFLVVHSSLAHQYGIVRGGYKLIYDQRNELTALLNLREDPGETMNWLGSRPAVARDLEVRLGTWRRLQLDYYGDASRHAKWYPPVLVD